MKIKLTELWAQASELNFGEAREILDAAQKAADDKLHEIRKRNIAAAGKSQEPLHANEN